MSAASGDGAHERLLELADRYLGEYLSKIERAIAGVDEEAVWRRANERSNAIGNLLLHLDGNLSQWFLGGLLGEPVERQRSAEFAARSGQRKKELLARLGTTVSRCRAGLAGLGAPELARRHTIQGEEDDGYGVLFHVVEHMSYHTGQIVLLAKEHLSADAAIEFYPQHLGE